MIIKIGKKYKISEWLANELKSPREVTISGSSGRTISLKNDEGSVYRIDTTIFLNHAAELLIHSGATQVIESSPEVITPVAPVTPTAPVAPIVPVIPVVTPAVPIVVPTTLIIPVTPVVIPTTPIAPVTPVPNPDPIVNPDGDSEGNPYGGNYL